MMQSDQQEIVIYDGDCGICNALKQSIKALDRHNRLRFIPFQHPDLEQIVPGPGRENASKAVFFLSRSGKYFRGARAIFEIMQRLPGKWRVWGRILSFPPFYLLTEPTYRLIAKKRAVISRLLGLDHCRIEDEFFRD